MLVRVEFVVPLYVTGAAPSIICVRIISLHSGGLGLDSDTHRRVESMVTTRWSIYYDGGTRKIEREIIVGVVRVVMSFGIENIRHTWIIVESPA